MRTRWGWMLLLLALGLAFGCSRRVPPPTLPPGEADTTRLRTPRPGYDGDSGYRQDLDVSPLAGRRIVLDPGHGGRWAGSMGVAGTREADANLRVSTVLADLLRRAGAQVWLTRTADTSLVVAPDTLLADDLRARARLADSLRAEVFLSVHHNADAGARHDVNETQTYYRTGDEGPSLDLAQAIHRRMVRGLRLETDRLLPGNYAVLRQTSATAAVLGEPSYLTYPPVEEILRRDAAIRLEAESYFMGLLDYFRLGVPQLAGVRWDPSWRGSPAWRPLVAEVEGDVEGITWSAGGTPAPSASLTRRVRGGRTEITYAPATPWRDGPLPLELQVRNANGNHSRRLRDTLDVDLAPARLVVYAWPESVVGGTVSFTAQALDAFSRPLHDSLAARDVAWSVEVAGTPRLWSARPRAGNGESRAYLTPARAAQTRVRVRWRGLEAERTLPAAAGPWRTGFVVRVDSDSGLAGARVLDESSGAAAATNADGYFALPGRGVAALRPVAAGYHAVDSTRADVGGTVRLPLARIAAGALIGRRIALDPEGGGDESGGTGPGGVRGASVNLAIARIARGYLERAGATVVLTREADAPTPALLRVQRAEAARAERLVRIGRRTGGPSATGYFPGSVAGRALAERLHQRLWRAEEEINGPPAPGDSARRLPVLLEDANYVLQQTSSPAVSFRPGDLRSSQDEERFLDPAWRHREAYALYAALAEDLGAARDTTLRPIALTLRDGGRTPAGVAVTLDGMTQLSDARGAVRYSLLDPRVRHRIEVWWPGDAQPRDAWLTPGLGASWQWPRASAAPTPVR